MGALRFTREHEWIRTEGELGTIGITDYAQQQLGDIVFVEFPEIGSKVTKGTQAAVVESVKAASEVYAPVSGEVIAVNEALAEDPGRVNTAAESDGWFFRIRISDVAELEDLLDKSAYAAHVASVA
ncbi:MAG: glycine cleavage system protein GcvH [Rhodospirillales bacterium]